MSLFSVSYGGDCPNDVASALLSQGFTGWYVTITLGKQKRYQGYLEVDGGTVRVLDDDDNVIVGTAAHMIRHIHIH